MKTSPRPLPAPSLPSHGLETAARPRGAPAASLAGLALLVALAGSGCSRKAQATAGPLPGEGFAIASATVADAVHERSFVAELRAKRRVEVRSRIKGFIESVEVDEGQKVREGQLLFTVNVTELRQQDQIARAAIERARADLQAATLDRDNTRLLFEGDVVSQAELSLAEAKRLAAKAALDEARATRAAINLEYAQIAAPFAGVVNRIPLRAGSPVDDTKTLTTLTDTSEVYAYFRVSEAEYLGYTNEGARFPERVWLRLADGSVLPSAGVVDAIESEFDRDTGSLAIRARFPNENGRLKHGSTGTIIVKTELKSVVQVPQKSTFEVQEQLYLYVVDSTSTARARRIVPRFRVDDSFVIASGLAAGEKFVLEGVQKLDDGMALEARAASATSGT